MSFAPEKTVAASLDVRTFTELMDGTMSDVHRLISESVPELH